MSRAGMMEKLGLTQADFEPNKTHEQRITELENELQTLKSFVNSLGKTELQGEGTAENPFNLVEGMELVPNAYYLYQNTRYVYMGSASTWDGSELTFESGWAEF